MKKENPIIYFMLCYFILVIIIHLGVSIWGDYKVNQLTKNSTAIIYEETGDKNIDESIKPLIDLGNNAKITIYKIFVFIIGDLVTIMALILPNFIREGINEWVNDIGYKELNWDTLNKYFFITSGINVVLFFIDIKSVFDEASIYTNLIN